MSAYSVLITGGRVVDGTGNPWFYGDVALAGDRIAAIAPPGTIDPSQAAEVVDAAGLVVCPGFIDILSHSIIPLMVDPACLSKITQGVTTEIMGEASTPAPFGEQSSFIDSPMMRLAPAWAARIRSWTHLRAWRGAVVASGVWCNGG